MSEMKYITATVSDALLANSAGKMRQTSRSPEALQKAADDFEAVFVNFMLKSMRKTVVKSGLLESGLGGEIMESMFDQKLSEQIAGGSNLGIAEKMIQQLSSEGMVESAADNTLVQRQQLPYKPAVLPESAHKVIFNALNIDPAKPQANEYLDMPLNQRLAAFEGEIDAAANRYGVDKNLIKAVVAAESAGNPYAVSRRGAKGLMQLMDATADSLNVKDSFDPVENINGGTKYLARLLRKYKGDVEMALAGYNAGPGNVRKYGGIPPFRETQQYIQRVQRYYQRFAESMK